MARRFAKRDAQGNITGSVKWPHPDYPDEIDDQDADFLAYMDRASKPLPDPHQPARDAMKARPDNAPITKKDLVELGLI